MAASRAQMVWNGVARRVRKSRALAAAGVLTVALSAALAGLAAQATIVPAENQVIIGSGSATAYPVISGLDDLFNSLPGCNLIALPGSVQPLDFSCTPGRGSPPPGAGENWVNDVAALEPPLGSSNGLAQLENQGIHTIPTAPVSYATSSRAPKSSDTEGLNFVAYAEGGVSWFHWTKVRGVRTPSAKITSLTTQQLQGIWNGTYTNWDQVGGSKAPIDVYAAASGAGDESTWSSFLGFSDQTYILSKGASYAGRHIIGEDEDSSIIANKDEADAIFYYSYGRYANSCKIVCGGSKVPGTSAAKPTTTALGKINGVAPSRTSITGGTFPVPQFLYNVYSDGFDPALPAASPATLNLVSEVGFLCKPNTYTSAGTTHPILDPDTGVPVRTEIDKVITSHGYFPLPLGQEGIVPHPASLAGTVFAPYDPTGQTEYQGYCRVITTDNNSSP